MTKAKFIESVFIRVNGGSITTDSAVMRIDIEAYLPAAINAVVTEGYFIQAKEEGNRDINTQFYTYFSDLEILTDTERKNKPYINLPASLIAIPSNRALRHVMDNCDNPYIPLNDNHLSALNYWLNVFKDSKFYRLEGRKVYLYNKPKPVERMNVLMLVGVDDLADDAELPIPAGLEPKALNICYELVTGIRQQPADKKNDSRDLN